MLRLYSSFLSSVPEVEERDDTRETVQFPSQGHEIQFDDPLYDPYLDDNPFNTSPQRSPVPEYTRPAPQPTETIELDDGFADQKEPRYYQIVEVSMITGDKLA